MQSYLDGEPPRDGETAKARDWAVEWKSSVVDGSLGRNTQGERDSAGGVAFLGKRGEITDWLIWGQ